MLKPSRHTDAGQAGANRLPLSEYIDATKKALVAAFVRYSLAMIKTTLAVMASLMLVACGKGDEPKGTNPAGQNADSVVTDSKEAASKVVASKVVDSKVTASKVETGKAAAVTLASGNPILASAPTLTLTYFNLDG